MIQVQRFNKVLKLAVILGDLVILNVLFISFNSIWNELFGERACSGTLPQILTLFSVCYFACTISGGVILHRRGARADQIVFRVLRNVFYFSFLSTGLMVLSELEIYSKRFFIYYFILLILCITVYRLLFRFCIQLYRSHGGNFRTVLYLGSTENIAELYHEMTSDATTGYRVLGYFDTTPNAKFPASCTYLGKPEQAIDYLAQHKVNQLYCCLPSALSEQIVPVINYCENNLIHFYSVPNVRNYLRHRMHFEMIGSVPILSIRKEPLGKIENRLIKRIFDVIFSLLFLCTLFPIIFLIVGVTIKITSSGPIFFRQKRNGLNNKEFWCYKFRSMKVNKESDTLQATLNDPRKTKFGDFMRRTNIDELPQFINVLLGDMSIVGPRPHMLKHTEEYSKIINKYMVRHFIKPGITGWAQVTGFRGETRELEDMEGRLLSSNPAEMPGIEEIQQYRRIFRLIKKSILPLKEHINKLLHSDNTLLHKSNRPFFNDVNDHLQFVLQTLEGCRDMISALVDLYLSNNDQRMNGIMKQLTIVSTIFIPLTFLAGIWGMNFSWMPELNWKYGYLFAWILMLVTGTAVYLLFRRKKWY